MRFAVHVLLLFFFVEVQASVCQDDLVKFFSKNKGLESQEALKSKVEGVIKKPLDEKRLKAIENSIEMGRKEIYTGGDITAQTKALTKAGFTKPEIEQLRKADILPSSMVRLSRDLPSKIEAVTLNMRKIDVEDVEKMKKGEKIRYVVGDDGEHYLLNKSHDFTDDILWIAKGGSKSKEVANAGFVVREAGELSYNQATRKFEFNSQYGMSLADEDAMAISKKIESATGQKVAVKKSGTASRAMESKTYECLDILSAQNSGKNFILNRIVPDNSIAVAGIAVGEALGAGRLQTEQGREVVAADLIGTNMGVVVGGYVGSKLVLSNSSFLTALGTRAAVGMGMINMQKHVYEGVLSEDAGERAEKIATFDQYHFAGRLVWGHMFDKFMVGNTRGAFNLPNMIFKACQNNSKLKILVNPQTVRLVEKGASAAIYYGLRQSVIGE